jgi:hypothetical protein
MATNHLVAISTLLKSGVMVPVVVTGMGMVVAQPTRQNTSFL